MARTELKVVDQREQKFCPQCRTVAHKGETDYSNCDHCHFEWCWQCSQPYTRGHGSWLNPMGCGAEFTHHNVAVRWSLRALWLLTLIVLFPVFLVLFIPCYCAWKGGVYTYEQLARTIDEQDAFTEVSNGGTVCLAKGAIVLLSLLVGVLAFAIGVALNLLIVPIFITVFLFCMVPYYFVAECQRGQENPSFRQDSSSLSMVLPVR